MAEEVGVLEQAAINAGFKPKEAAAQQQTPATGGENPDANTPADDDIPDEKLLAALSKKTGRQIKSLEDLKPTETATELTPEEKAAKAQEKQNKALLHALTNGKVKGQEELKQYATIESLSARDFAYNQYKNDRLAENKDLTEEDIENEFADLNFEAFDETDPKRKAALKRWESDKQNYITNNFGHILNIEKEYDEYLNDAAGAENFAKRIDPLVPQNLTFDFEDTDADDKKVKLSYPFTPTQETLNEVAKEFKGEMFYQLYEKSGKGTDQDIQEAIKHKIILKELPRIIKEVSNAHAEKKVAAILKGRRGIPNERLELGGSVKTSGGGFLDAAYERLKNS